jgi:hypothetical protein
MIAQAPPPTDHLPSIRRRVRLIILLQAAESAGLAPLRILRLHTFAYLSNVLAPVWDFRAPDGKVLKRRGGPFYPALQRDLDRLVGMGLVTISGLGHVRDEEKRWRLEGSYRLNHPLANAVINHVSKFEEERRLVSFVDEVAFALSALSDADLDRAVSEDATYSDPLVSFGNVVDFDEWRRTNYSANAARQFENLIPSGTRATPGEMLHLYVRHLRRRIHGGR